MANETILQVRMDSELKEQAELLYKQLGTSFAEALKNEQCLLPCTCLHLNQREH